MSPACQTITEMCEYSKIVRAEGRAEGEMTEKAESVFNLMRSSGVDFDATVKMLCYSEIAAELKPLVDAMLKTLEN